VWLGRGVMLAADVKGEGQGRTVVCLPWFGLDSSVTANALEPVLAGCPDRRRIYVDLPGCGESPPGPANSDGVVDLVPAGNVIRAAQGAVGRA
jgi:pimeloyl-ACP methyl ester carboxylesterase